MPYNEETRSKHLGKMKALGKVLLRQAERFEGRDTSEYSRKDLLNEVKYVQGELDDLYDELR